MHAQFLNPQIKRTLQEVNFVVGQGEWVTLLGANGSGKSTLARLANGMLLPSFGEVVVDGVSSWHHDHVAELHKRVGLVTQDPDNQIVSTTVFDEVAFGPQNLGWEPARIYAAVSDALAKVGLPEEEFAKRDPNTLSGGEKQRVVIASILAMMPDYLVLDEPTSLLDPVSRAQVLEAIAGAAREGHGILHITHLLKEASFSNRVLVLSDGKLVYDGPPALILADDAALTAFGLKAEPEARGRLTPLPEPEIAQKKSLEFSDVSFTYSKDPALASVLDKVNFTLTGGDCMVLVGASGSGKSTLLSLAAGLLQPSAGKVLLKGAPPTPGKVGLVFQQPENQLFAQTVAEDILFGPRNMGTVSEAQGAELISEVLTAVGLDPSKFKHRSPYSLSGGEARRAAIATILALRTDFLLLDEPTAGLDARGKVFVYELVQKLLTEEKGLIIATHDPDFFMDLATLRMEL